MKEIKILHMFPQLLSLYGEHGNIAVLKAQLEKAGHTVTITGYESGTPDLQQDMIYMGSGTEDNILEALKRLQPHADAIRASVEEGALWLITGNAMALFGSQILRKETAFVALAVFDYVTEIDDSRRFLGDVLTDSSFAASACLGFVNTSCIYRGIANPLLTLVLGNQLGNDKASPAEGLHEKNFYGTQLIGPFLTKNPHVLSHMAQLLTGQPHACSADSMIQKAYTVSLSELQKRLS